MEILPDSTNSFDTGRTNVFYIFNIVFTNSIPDTSLLDITIPSLLTVSSASCVSNDATLDLSQASYCQLITGTPNNRIRMTIKFKSGVIPAN